MDIKQRLRAAFGLMDIKELAQHEFSQEPKGTFEYTAPSAEGVRYWGSDMVTPGFERIVRVEPVGEAQEEREVVPPDFLSPMG